MAKRHQALQGGFQAIHPFNEKLIDGVADQVTHANSTADSHKCHRPPGDEDICGGYAHQEYDGFQQGNMEDLVTNRPLWNIEKKRTDSGQH
jgi:hypothetical protein